MRMTLKVYKEKGSYIGVLPHNYKTSATYPDLYKTGKGRERDKRLKLFRAAYRKAEVEGFKKKEIEEYVKDEFFNSEESILLDDVEYKTLLKKEINRRYQIIKRYRRKVEWFTPNYFVTFTYDDKKTNEADFENKLLHTISNLATRHGWRGMGAAERGKKTDRLHYHFMFYIPEGEMVGELFTDYHWDGKKREYFTNNTYFNDRFGDADFKAVTVNDKEHGSISNYLIKYIVKDGGHIYYTRHLPTEKEIEVDLAQDVVLTFVDYSTIKVILGLHLFLTPEELDSMGAKDWVVIDDGEPGFNLEGLQSA